MVVENRGFLPREGTAVLPIVSFQVQALVESVEETPIEDFIETFEQLKLVFEDHGATLFIAFRHFDHN